MAYKWFRMHSDSISDDKLCILSFADRWHFFAVCCLKCNGVLDDSVPERDKRIAKQLGVTVKQAESIRARLVAVKLITENWQPVAWDKRQYKSDDVTQRVQKHRQKKNDTP